MVLIIPRNLFIFSYPQVCSISGERLREKEMERVVADARRWLDGKLERLAKVKKMVDPHNFFEDEPSVPPIS
ncbi:cinnamyl-alcohol dehydrogenase [Salvia divinorum]|uniref:Cinnamyl-alcohol dehydrogenase n=1 Tax=Salvia divinorum TaxID=28513 RepID=A0ABD1GPN7_SALDI